MPHIFEGQTANDAWKEAFFHFLRTPPQPQESRNGGTNELIHTGFYIHEPSQRWVPSRAPAINPAFAIAETFWILSGDNESQLVNFWNPSLPKFSGTGATYYGAYGERIRKRFGVDQLIAACEALSYAPNSRQVVIQIWDAKTDFPITRGLPRAQDIPCNICSTLKVRNNKLEWLQLMRSNDLYRGTPYNFIQFTTIQEIIAGILNIELGSYFHVVDSLHIYNTDTHNMSCNKDTPQLKNTDSLMLPKHDFVDTLKIVYDKLKKLSSPDLTPKCIHNIIYSNDMPQSYKNLLHITTCDAAMRRDWSEEINEARSMCSNPILTYLWDQWHTRQTKRRKNNG